MNTAHHPYVAVVGGCNFDIYATPDQPLLQADSNPGHIFTAPGGVGRNIAENLSRLNVPTIMLTALGTDAFGDAIIKQASETGLDLSHALRLPHASTSVYMCINQNDGDIAVAVSDMDICTRINPAYLQEHTHMLEGAAFVVADANLTEETLLYLSEKYGHKLCVDCVSVPKATRLKSCLKHLFCVKANRAEGSAISGVSIQTVQDASNAANMLHQYGVQRVIISLGEDGAYVSDTIESHLLPLMPGETLNTSGCGDAFFAGALLATVEQRPILEILKYGLAMARICAASNAAVSPLVTRQHLSETLHKHEGGFQ